MKEKDISERMIEIINAIGELPEEGQEAIGQVANKIGFIREICRNPGTTRKGLEERMEKYKVKEDYFGQILAGLALQYMDEEEK